MRIRTRAEQEDYPNAVYIVPLVLGLLALAGLELVMNTPLWVTIPMAFPLGMLGGALAKLWYRRRARRLAAAAEG